MWAFEEIDLKEYLLRRGVVRAAGRVAEPQRLCVREKGCESYYSGARGENSAGVARRPRALALSNLPTHRK